MFGIRRVQHRETSSEESISAPLTLGALYCDRVEFQMKLLPRFPLQLADLIIIQQPAHKLDCNACRCFIAMQIHALKPFGRVFETKKATRINRSFFCSKKLQKGLFYAISITLKLWN
jgi:hypothetical protein